MPAWAIDFGYAHIPSGEYGLVTDEPWFRHGLRSINYIPRHLYAIFLQSFDVTDAFPYLVPLTTGLSVTLSAPSSPGRSGRAARWWP